MTFILLTTLGIYLLIGAVLFFFQEKIIFQGSKLSLDHEFQFEGTFEEITLRPEGAELNALLFRADASKGAILYFHGNRGNLERWGKIVQHHVGLGYDVLVMDYRGYGKSRGVRTKENLLADAQLFYEHLKQEYEEDRITLYGRSLGTGLATYVASKNDPARLILETPYYEFKSVIQRYLPIYPIGAGLRFNFKSYEYIPDVACPIYFFHGTDDAVVTYASGKKLFEMAPKDKAEFITIEGGSHNDLVEFEAFREGLEKVLKD